MTQKHAHRWLIVLLFVLIFSLAISCTLVPMPRPLPTPTPVPTPTSVPTPTGVTPFHVTVTNQQLTDALASALSKVQEVEISKLQASIHSDGITVTASVGALNFSFHVMLQVSIRLEGGRPVVEIKRVEFEGVPSHLNNVVTELLKGLLGPYLQQIPEQFAEGQITSIQLMEGQMVIEGYR